MEPLVRVGGAGCQGVSGRPHERVERRFKAEPARQKRCVGATRGRASTKLGCLCMLGTEIDAECVSLAHAAANLMLLCNSLSTMISDARAARPA